MKRVLLSTACAVMLTALAAVATIVGGSPVDGTAEKVSAPQEVKCALRVGQESLHGAADPKAPCETYWAKDTAEDELEMSKSSKGASSR